MTLALGLEFTGTMLVILTALDVGYMARRRARAFLEIPRPPSSPTTGATIQGAPPRAL